MSTDAIFFLKVLSSDAHSIIASHCTRGTKVIEMRQPLVSRDEIEAEQGKGDIKLCSTSFPDAKEKRNAYRTKLTRWGIWSRRYVMHYCKRYVYIMHYCNLEIYYALLKSRDILCTTVSCLPKVCNWTAERCGESIKCHYGHLHPPTPTLVRLC